MAAPRPLFDIPEKPYQPIGMKFPIRKCGTQKQHKSFQGYWFDWWKWLHYDVVNDLAFCHSCVKAAKVGKLKGEPDQFVTEGFYQWHIASTYFDQHEKCDTHKEALKLTSNKSIVGTFLDLYKDFPKKPNQPYHRNFCKTGCPKNRKKMGCFQGYWFLKWKWLHYDEELECICCHWCVAGIRAGKLNIPKENALVKGYSYWKNMFNICAKHEKTDLHRKAVNIMESNKQKTNEILRNREELLKSKGRGTKVVASGITDKPNLLLASRDLSLGHKKQLTKINLEYDKISKILSECTRVKIPLSHDKKSESPLLSEVITEMQTLQDTYSTLQDTKQTQCKVSEENMWQECTSYKMNSDILPCCDELHSMTNKYEDNNRIGNLQYDFDDRTIINILAVGDVGCGKASILNVFAQDQPQLSLTPMQISVGGVDASITLNTISGLENESDTRLLIYQCADVVLMVFSIASQESLKNVTTQWISEVWTDSPKAPIVLVGNKQDLLKEESSLQEVISCQHLPVYKELGYATADNIGAYDYIECSAKLSLGIVDVFQTAVKSYLDNNN